MTEERSCPNCETCGAECAAKRYPKNEIEIAYECLFIDKGSYWQRDTDQPRPEGKR